MDYEQFFHDIYAAFNARDIDAVLKTFHPDVHWPNGWEGGFVEGHDAVRAYWTRQWKEVNPIVEPVAVKEQPDGSVAVEVHQVVKDYGGAMLFDGYLRHIYRFEQGLVTSMEIRN